MASMQDPARNRPPGPGVSSAEGMPPNAALLAAPSEARPDPLGSDEVEPAVAEATLPRRPATPPPAFDEFFRAEYPRMLRAMYLVCGNRAEAEEVAQDAFVRAFERWELVVRAENRPGYVYRIALNLYRSKLRRAARLARKTLRPAPQPDELEAMAERDAIGRALASLSPAQREAVIMREWLDMTDEEIGALLGISPITVRVRVHRARAVLRPLLEERGE